MRKLEDAKGVVGRGVCSRAQPLWAPDTQIPQDKHSNPSVCSVHDTHCSQTELHIRQKVGYSRKGPADAWGSQPRPYQDVGPALQQHVTRHTWLLSPRPGCSAFMQSLQASGSKHMDAWPRAQSQLRRGRAMISLMLSNHSFTLIRLQRRQGRAGQGEESYFRWESTTSHDEPPLVRSLLFLQALRDFQRDSEFSVCLPFVSKENPTSPMGLAWQ